MTTGNFSAIGNFAHGGSCEAAVIASGERLVRVGNIDEVMRDAGALFVRGFGGAEIHTAVDGDGIATDDLAVEAFGEGEREGGFAAAGGSENEDGEGVLWISHLDPQRMKHEILDWRIWRGRRYGTSSAWG